jgi:hypothetical protein
MPLDVHIESFSHSSQEEHGQFSSRRRLNSSTNSKREEDSDVEVPPFVQEMEQAFNKVVGRMEVMLHGMMCSSLCFGDNDCCFEITFPP